MTYFYEVIRGDGPVRLQPCERRALSGEMITFDKQIPEGRVLLSNTFGNISDELINMQFSPLKKGQVFVVSFSDTLKITGDRLFANDTPSGNEACSLRGVDADLN